MRICSGMYGASRILRKSEFSKYTVNQRSPVEIQPATQWHLIDCSIIAVRVCGRPAVFFHDLRLIARLFRKEKFDRFKKRCYFIFFFLICFKSEISLIRGVPL